MSGTSGRNSHRGTPKTDLSTFRGHAKLALIRDLALGEWSYREIAAQLDCVASDVAVFAALEADAISEVKAALATKLAEDTAGLWIAKRRNRVAELQSDFDDTTEWLRITAKAEPGGRGHLGILRARREILSQVASEYAPLRGKNEEPDDENVMRYVLEIDGLKMSDI